MHIDLWKQRLSGGKLDDELAGLYGSAASRERTLSLLDEFAAHFGDMDVSVVSAPGRTELAGNHTDHQNGIVLAAAVTLDAQAVAAPAQDDTVLLFSTGFGEICVELSDPAPRAEERGTSAGIIRGVADGLRSRGIPVKGFRAVMSSDVPTGGGLSSSAAFEVLLGAIFSLFSRGSVADPLTLATVGQRAERDYFGKPSGLMDQAASAFGGITMIDFADLSAPAVTPIRFDFRQHGYVLCAVDTHTSHADLAEDYAAIPREMTRAANAMGQPVLRYVNQAEWNEPAVQARMRGQLPQRAILRAEHFFAENARVPQMAEALRQGDMETYISLMNASGASSRDKLQNVIPGNYPEQTDMADALDFAASLLQGKGAWRIHGGGFAGCIQCLVPEADYPAFRHAMDGRFGKGACFELRMRPCGAHVLGSGL